MSHIRLAYGPFYVELPWLMIVVEGLRPLWAVPSLWSGPGLYKILMMRESERGSALLVVSAVLPGWGFTGFLWWWAIACKLKWTFTSLTTFGHDVNPATEKQATTTVHNIHMGFFRSPLQSWGKGINNWVSKENLPGIMVINIRVWLPMLSSLYFGVQYKWLDNVPSETLIAKVWTFSWQSYGREWDCSLPQSLGHTVFLGYPQCCWFSFSFLCGEDLQSYWMYLPQLRGHPQLDFNPQLLVLKGGYALVAFLE